MVTSFDNPRNKNQKQSSNGPGRILTGERGEPLLDGLDPIDTAIARETLTRLT